MQTPNKKDPIKILLVDDDADFATSAKNCLKTQCNYQIESASSVDEALEKMDTEKPDAIVCDIQMPNTNGFDFLKTLRDKNNTIPFIVFTVTDDKQTALKAFNLGADGFVGKYGNPETVFSTLQRCIEKAIMETK